jgi:hypothetical protein
VTVARHSHNTPNGKNYIYIFIIAFTSCYDVNSIELRSRQS